MKTSPSRLVYVEACPKFKPTPFQSDAANEGIDLHAALEELVTKAEPWEYQDFILNDTDHNWTQEQKGLLCKAAESLSGIIGEFSENFMRKAYRHCDMSTISNSVQSDCVFPGLYPEIKIKVGEGRHGFIDLLIINENKEAIIVDYKFVRSSSDFELQLAAYAVALNKTLPFIKKIKAVIIDPYLNDAENALLQWDYDERKLREYEAIIDKIDESVDDPNCFPKPGAHCERCKYNGKCAYQAKTVGIGLDFSLTRLTEILDPKTDEDRALRRDFMKCAEALVTSIKDDDKAYFEHNPDAELPGWRKTTVAGRATLDKDQASAINEAILATFPVAEPRDILESSVPDVAQLAETLSFKTGVPADTVKGQLNVALEPYMKRSAPYVVLRKMSTKQRVK